MTGKRVTGAKRQRLGSSDAEDAGDYGDEDMMMMDDDYGGEYGDEDGGSEEAPVGNKGKTAKKQKQVDKKPKGFDMKYSKRDLDDEDEDDDDDDEAALKRKLVEDSDEENQLQEAGDDDDDSDS